MKVYLSGPMTGVENYKEIFNQYEKRLTELGFTVFNPAWFDYKEGWSYDEILDLDLAALQKCEAIFMLPGWEKSKGACIEYGYALSKGINIMHVGYLDNAETWEKMHEKIYGSPTIEILIEEEEEKTVSKLEDGLKNLHSDFGSLAICIRRGMTREEFQQWLDDSETHEFFKKKYRANEETKEDIQQYAEEIRQYCRDIGTYNEEACPFFRGYEERDNNLRYVKCELNQGHCSPCNWEIYEEDEEPLVKADSVFGMSCRNCVDDRIPPYKGKCFFCARVNRQALNDMYREKKNDSNRLNSD